MRIHSATHNGAIPGRAMYNKARLCSIRWALGKRLRNVVIERRGCSGKCCDCKACFFPAVHAPFKKWVCWPRSNVALQTFTCFQHLRETGVFRRNLMKAFDSFRLLASLTLCCPLLAGFLVSLSRLFWRIARRRTSFHWITQRTSLPLSFYFQLFKCI